MLCYAAHVANCTTFSSAVFRQVGFKCNFILEMWANAQRDGRPAEYRWRPLFNAAKFG